MNFSIPIPQSPVLDARTGLISRDWYLFLVNLFKASASGAVGTTTQVLHGGGVGYSAVDLAADVTGILPGVNGGTGVSNALKTLTMGGNINFGGAFATTPSNTITIVSVAATNVTMPASGTLITGISLSGDVFATGTNTGTAVATITASAVGTSKVSANAITNAKLAQMPTMTFKANNTGGTADPLDITVSQATTMLMSTGSWTPTDGSGAGLSLTVTKAEYAQIGNAVFVQAFITYPITASGANSQIDGLPVATVTNGIGTARVEGATGTDGAQFSGSSVFPGKDGAQATNAQLSAQNLVFSGLYFAS